MSVFKTVKFKFIIGKVLRDFDIEGVSWVPDAIEWIGEALKAVRHVTTYEKTQVVLNACDHKAAFPCGFYSLRYITYKGHVVPLGSTRDYRAPSKAAGQQEKLFSGIYSLPDLDGSSTTINSEETKAPTYVTGEYYLLNPNYIVTSWETGEFTLHYLALPVDEEGFPLFPDSYEHLEFISHYIAYKLMGRNYRIGGDWTRRELKAEKDEWLRKARITSKASILRIDNMEKFTNSWARLKFDREAFNNSFRDASLKEYVRDI